MRSHFGLSPIFQGPRLPSQGIVQVDDVVNLRPNPARIAILGWGSLLWQEGTENAREFNEHHHEWNPEDDAGPSLKLEFSRISESRSGALTLVLDYKHGEPCQVAYALSKRNRSEDAICDLRCREGTVLRKIGCYFVNDAAKTRWVDAHPDARDAIANWARERGIPGVVWTGLESNFRKHTGKEFSVDAARRHVQNLGATGQTKAAEYVLQAPDFVDTPLRRGLQSDTWFRNLLTEIPSAGQ